MTQCPNCGAGLRPEGVRCVKCGSVLRAAPAHALAPVDPPPLPRAPLFAETKSAGLAFVLSLLLPGLGQLYNAEIVKAVLFFAARAVALLMCLGWLVHLVAAVEAYQAARSFNRRVTS
jgi:TM2 domain-containing membrane protein YozV